MRKILQLNFPVLFLLAFISCSNLKSTKTHAVEESLEISSEVNAEDTLNHVKQKSVFEIFPGHVYNINYPSRWIYDIQSKDKSILRHCRELSCYKFSEDIDVLKFKEKKLNGLRASDEDHMILSTPVYSDAELSHKAGEVITLYRNVYKNWKDDCELGHSYPDKVVDKSFLETLKTNYDYYENMNRDAGYCKQYFYDGEEYHKIDLNQHPAITLRFPGRSVFKIEILKGGPVVYAGENYVFKVNSYDQPGRIPTPNTSYSSDYIYGHTKDQWDNLSSPWPSSSVTSEIMLRDFLVNGTNSRYIAAFAQKMPLSLKYDPIRHEVEFKLARKVPNLPEISRISLTHKACDPTKSYSGRYLTLYGLYHCVNTQIESIEVVKIPLEDLINYSTSSNFPHIASFDKSTYSPEEIDHDMSVYKFDEVVEIPLSIDGYEDIFRSLRNGEDISEDRLNDKVFDSCHRSYMGKDYSCEVVVHLDML